MKWIPFLFLLIGMALIVTGVALIHIPSAFIVGGALLVILCSLFIVGG